jgi:hypothetical protein
LRTGICFSSLRITLPVTRERLLDLIVREIYDSGATKKRMVCEQLLVMGVVVIGIAALALKALLVAVIMGLAVLGVAVVVIVLLALCLVLIVLIAFTVAHLVEAVLGVVRMRLLADVIRSW